METKTDAVSSRRRSERVAEPLRAHVVIVGAGVAGMLAAYRLAQAGVKVFRHIG